MDQNKIGEFIAQCRKEHNMTQMQFAEKLGVTNKAVSKWETGKCLPDAALFDDICMLVICTWGALMYFTQKDRCTQRVALIINMVLGGVSLIAFVLSFWDVNSQVVLWIGFPCEILFYGFKLFWDWICIYFVVTVLAIVGIEYSKRNLSEQSTK